MHGHRWILWLSLWLRCGGCWCHKHCSSIWWLNAVRGMPSGGSDISLIYGLQAGEVVHSLHFLKMSIESSVFLCENGRMAMLFSALTCKIISKSCQQLWQLVTIFFANINAHHLCSPRTFQFGYLQLKSFNSILGLYHASLNFLLHCILHNIKPWTLKSGSTILIFNLNCTMHLCS